MTVVTIAHYRLPAEDAEQAALLADLATIVRATRGEDGNRGVEVIRDEADGAHLMLVERWIDAQALTDHRRTAHFTAGIVGSIAPRLEGRDVFVGVDVGL